MLDGAGIEGRIQKRVAVEDAAAFLDRLAKAATAADAPSEGMLDIASTSTLSKRTTVQVVEGILSGTLGQVGIPDPH